jgi:hypothetical protein
MVGECCIELLDEMFPTRVNDGLIVTTTGAVERIRRERKARRQ